MTTPTRNLLLSCAAALAVLAVSERVIARVVPQRLPPMKKLARALEAGDGCVVFAGDSRMEAGLDLAVVAEELRTRGRSVCLADLTTGGVPLEGQVLAVRAYLESGRKPREIVLGMTMDVPFEPENASTDLKEMVGSRTVIHHWFQFQDLALHYPGYPAHHFVEGSRFLLRGSNGLSRYLSVAWQKVQDLQKRLVGAPKAERNRFGGVEDMKELHRKTYLRGAEMLARSRTTDGAWREHRWFTELKRVAREHGVRLRLVEHPTASIHGDSVSLSPAGVEARRFLAESLRSDWSDLRAVDGLSDGSYPDHMHLSDEGARLFSRRLAAEL